MNDDVNSNDALDPPAATRPQHGMTGHALIADYLKRLDGSPGVYRMLNAKGEVLYVGKARNLKARVSNYARPSGHSARIARMIHETASMMFLTTRTETEALLLEQNLIKQLKPRYNVLARDDKSFPNILIATDHPYPMIKKHRGARKEKGHYFGPFASASAVNRTLNQLERVFLLRNCSDSMFETRTRPCLQYQIERCTAPCVGLISPEDYAEDVRHAVMFLEGRNSSLIDELVVRMEVAAKALQFEQAARFRDQIASLRRMQETQSVSGEGGDRDVIAVVSEAGTACVQVFFKRNVYNPR